MAGKAVHSIGAGTGRGVGLIADLASDGLTVLLSSHLMGEVEQLCTELAVVAKGRIRFAGTISEMREGHSGHDYRLSVTDPGRAAAASAGLARVEVTTTHAGELLVRAEPEDAAALTVALGRAGVGILSMLPDAPKEPPETAGASRS